VKRGLTVGSLRGMPMGSRPGAAPARPALAMAAPARPKRCCGTGCAGCPYGNWLRQMRATLGTAPELHVAVDGLAKGP
jgi:hypothetical protein